MNYINSFKNRCERYLYAVKTYPHVMEEEFNTAYDMLDIPNIPNIPNILNILNIPAAGLNIFKKIEDRKDIIVYNYETSPDFAKFGFPLCTYTQMPLPSSSIERIIILASLHHTTLDERPEIYNELKRLLKHNGALVIGDVIKNSKQDKWLNEFVNKWNSNGHSGLFFCDNEHRNSNKDIELLENAGFRVNINTKKYKWNFNNTNEMIDFTINLFGLDLFETENKKEDIINYIKDYLNYFEIFDLVNKEKIVKCGFDWELVYFKCIKI